MLGWVVVNVWLSVCLDGVGIFLRSDCLVEIFDWKLITALVKLKLSTKYAFNFR